MELLQPLREFGNYFKIISATLNMLEDAISLWNDFEIISRKFLRAEIKLFQTDISESWNDFEIISFHL